MKSLVTTTLLRGLLQSIVDMGSVPVNVAAAYAAISKEDAIYMLDESYEIAKIFNTPTHQVVMLKSFEEEMNEPDDNDGDDEGFEVGYSTSYQVTQIMFHNGAKISRSFGFEVEAERDAAWMNLSQESAQKFVDATVKFIDNASAGE